MLTQQIINGLILISGDLHVGSDTNGQGGTSLNPYDVCLPPAGSATRAVPI